MREFRTEKSTDPYCAGGDHGRGRVMPARAVLKSFVLQKYGSDRRNTYLSDLKHNKNITIQSRQTYEKLTHNSDRMGSKSWHAFHVPFSFTSTLFLPISLRYESDGRSSNPGMPFFAF